jgi:hypothetical protein
VHADTQNHLRRDPDSQVTDWMLENIHSPLLKNAISQKAIQRCWTEYVCSPGRCESWFFDHWITNPIFSNVVFSGRFYQALAYRCDLGNLLQIVSTHASYNNLIFSRSLTWSIISMLDDEMFDNVDVLMRYGVIDGDCISIFANSRFLMPELYYAPPNFLVSVFNHSTDYKVFVLNNIMGRKISFVLRKKDGTLINGQTESRIVELDDIISMQLQTLEC